MRRKKVWRYYCDFCKKANCSGSSISKHEKSCTLNPDRQCGVCDVMETGQTDLVAAMALLPDPEKHNKVKASKSGDFFYYDDELTKIVAEALPKLRDETDNCPACIMAALRLKGIPVPLAKKFNYKDEMASIWKQIEADRETEYSDLCPEYF